jgi:hypothetical protein
MSRLSASESRLSFHWSAVSSFVSCGPRQLPRMFACKLRRIVPRSRVPPHECGVSATGAASDLAGIAIDRGLCDAVTRRNASVGSLNPIDRTRVLQFGPRANVDDRRFCAIRAHLLDSFEARTRRLMSHRRLTRPRGVDNFRPLDLVKVFTKLGDSCSTRTSQSCSSSALSS